MKNCNLKSNQELAQWYDLEIQKMDGNILELKLARPALRALVNEGIYTLEKLKTKTQVEIANIHGMGPSAIQKLVVFLKK